MEKQISIPEIAVRYYFCQTKPWVTEESGIEKLSKNEEASLKEG